MSGVDSSATSVSIQSFIEFQMRFSECIEYCSTAYLRVIYDMLQEEPEKYNYITGRSVDIAAVSADLVKPVSLSGELEF